MKWKDSISQLNVPVYNRRWEKIGEEYREEYKSTAYFGIFCISCLSSRKYKDGTFQFIVLISVPIADTTNDITLAKVRGTLDDAKAKAEKMLSCLSEVRQIYKTENK